MNSFTASLAPFKKEVSLLRLPGNNMPLPNTIPAPPAIMMQDISIVPWIQIAKKESINRPFVTKKYWKQPSIMAFLNKK